jgi:hypothetical protein
MPRFPALGMFPPPILATRVSLFGPRGRLVFTTQGLFAHVLHEQPPELAPLIQAHIHNFK